MTVIFGEIFKSAQASFSALSSKEKIRSGSYKLDESVHTDIQNLLELSL